MNTATGKTARLVDLQIEVLSSEINTVEEFEKAVSLLTLLLAQKINLRPSDVHKIVTKLHQLETAITEDFVAKHRGTSVSIEEALTAASTHRAQYLQRVLETGQF
jgi:hypothetical protein